MATVEKHGLEKAAIAFRSHVRTIEEKHARQHISGFGADAAFKDVSLGWFITLEGSHEALYAGSVKPDVSKGDLAVVRISFYGRE